MLIKNLAASSIIFILVLLGYNIAFSGNTEATPQVKQEYERDHKRAEDLNTSLSQRDVVRDLNAYEAFADSIDQKWRGRNREYYARLMLNICNPLSSGIFKEDRQYELARKYALTALEEPDSIPLKLELDLIGHVVTDIIAPGAPKGADFAKKRAVYTAVRLHAWKRLLGVIDPNWDSTEILSADIMPTAEMARKMGSIRSGMDPKAIKDSTLRAEYEELIRLNNEKLEKHQEQYEYRDWLNRFPKGAENHIIQAYSQPPFALEELRKMLNDQLPDKEAKTRIIAAVEKNMRESPKGIH